MRAEEEKGLHFSRLQQPAMTGHTVSHHHRPHGTAVRLPATSGGCLHHHGAVHNVVGLATHHGCPQRGGTLHTTMGLSTTWWSCLH